MKIYGLRKWLFAVTLVVAACLMWAFVSEKAGMAFMGLLGVATQHLFDGLKKKP